MDRRTVRWLMIGILILAAALRFPGLSWDGAIGAHPDERYLVGVAEGVAWPDGLNPFAVAPELAYGHLPVYALAIAAAVLRGVDPLLIGRALAAASSVLAVALTFGLAWRVCGPWVGVLAAAFVAVMAVHVQQARFYTADTLLVPLAMGVLCAAVRLAHRGRRIDAAVTGVVFGLAMAVKVSAGLLALPVGMACLIGGEPRRNVWRLIGWSAGAALIVFAVVSPFALWEASTFWQNLRREAAIARGGMDVPYTRQFRRTLPYVYPILQQLRWGMGWIVGAVAFGGLTYAIAGAIVGAPGKGEWVLLAWVVPGLAFFSALYTKYPRYLLPLTPILAIYGARLGVRLMQSRRSWISAVACGVLGLGLCGGLIRSLALVNSYEAPHPWHQASEWLYAHAPEGAVIAVERWDHPLPLEAERYTVRELPIFAADSREKWATMEATLSQADYVIIASRRGYGTLARWPSRYPEMTRYYRELFEDGGAFEPVSCFNRPPRLGPLALMDDPTSGTSLSLPGLCRADAPFFFRTGRLDESFVVYDHPRAILFRRAEAE